MVNIFKGVYTYVYGLVQDLKCKEFGIGVAWLLKNIVYNHPGVIMTFELVQQIISIRHLKKNKIWIRHMSKRN